MQQDGYKKIATISAPGKVILCGEHAVVYGEDALAMAISLRCVATLYARQSQHQSDPVITFTGSLNCIIRTQALPTNIPPQFSEYLTACSHQNGYSTEQAKIQYKIATFLKETGSKLAINKNTYLVEFKSEIPIGKCLGSSASFNTVLTAILFLVCGSVNKQDQEVDLEQINRISKVMERIEHGTPSGIDNFVATFGGLVLFNNTRSPPFLSIQDKGILDKITNCLQLRLIDSGVEKNTKTAVSVVRKNYESDEKYKMMIKQIGSFARQVVDLLKNEQDNGWTHKLLSITSENHKLLRQLGVSIPQIEQIVSQNTMTGERSAKITGSGMGGYVLILEIANSFQKTTAQNNMIIKIDRKGLIIQYY